MNPSLARRTPRAAFSLVEVVLAVGVVAFAVVSILGLLPTGMNIFRDSMNISVGAQIAQRVINDAQQAEFDTLIDQPNLPAPPNDEHFTFRAPQIKEPQLRYFDEQGNEIVPRAGGKPTPEERNRIIYHVNVRITPRAPIPQFTAQETGHLAQITVQVANNPGNRPIPIKINPPGAGDENSPDRNLFDRTTRGVSIQTFCALVGRNR